MLLTLAVLGTAGSTKMARADGFSVRIGDSHMDTERQMQELQRAVRNLQDRVVYLEQRLAIPPQPVTHTWACTIQDDFDKPYLGRGASQTEAEFNARNACTQSRNAMFCKGAPHCEAEN